MNDIQYRNKMKIVHIYGELNAPKSRWLRKLGMMETWFVIYHDLRTPADNIIKIWF